MRLTFDVDALRAEFPALALEQDGRPLALFDGPGGTQVPERVIEAVAAYYRDSNANAGGAFLTSERSDAMVEAAREAMADMLGAASADEIAFGANMTTLTFHVSRSLGALLEPGDEVVVTTLDHQANVDPWRLMAADRGAVIRTVDIRTDDCTLDLEGLDAALSSRTRVVAVGLASNAVGTINPVAEIVRRAHAVGARTYVDAVHFAPHGPIDVVELGTDFLVCSAYKFFGPHAGILYARGDLFETLPAYKVRRAHHRFETGTANFEGIAGIAAAVDYLATVGDRFGHPTGPGRRARIAAGMRAIRGYELALYRRLADGLEAIRGVRILGITDPERFAERCPTASIVIERVPPRAAAEALGRQGIAVWDGDFYATSLIERLGFAESGGVLRIGLVHYNTAAEVDRLLGALEAVASGAVVARA
jgi:cysteine desulfurase family protein (TIGR01976 family)